MDEQTRQLRDATMDALVDEVMAKRRNAGEVFSKPETVRALVRNDIAQQAREYPGWLRQQAKRLGLIKYEGVKAADCVCELCHRGIVGKPHAMRAGRPYCSQACASTVVMSLSEWLHEASDEDRAVWERLAGTQIAAAVDGGEF